MAEPEPSLFDEIDEQAEAHAEAEADADVAEGRLIPNAKIVSWLRTWGTSREKPAPKSWLK